ncbi:UPF0764 protein C16orf89 homolog [Discoglossus pictus]
MKGNILIILVALCNLASAHRDPLLRNLISSIKKATKFLNDSYRDFNLDGIIGYMALYEQVRGTSKKWALQEDLQDYCPELDRLATELNTGIEKSMAYLIKDNPDYFYAYKGFFQKDLWILPLYGKQINPNLEFIMLEESNCLYVGVSDECIARLFGTWDTTKESCDVPEKCQNLVTKSGCTDYALSHQQFYLMIGRMNRCNHSLFHQEFDHYSNIFCANMMKANIRIEHDEYPLAWQDLFMEHIMFCGLSNFSEFYKKRWLEKIISWQDSSGCFGDTALELFIKPKGAPKRFKRREKRMSSQCLSHKTCVAVAALGGFLFSYGVWS